MHRIVLPYPLFISNEEIFIPLLGSFILQLRLDKIGLKQV